MNLNTMKKLKIIAVILIIAMMFTTVAACRNEEGDETGSNNEGSNNTNTGITGGDDAITTQDGYTITALSDYVYLAQAVSLPDDINGNLWNYVCSGDKLYFPVLTLVTERTENSYLYKESVNIYSMNIDGTQLTQLEEYSHPFDIPGDVSGRQSIQNMTIDSDGNLWVVDSFNTFIYDLPDDFNEETENYWDYYADIDWGIAIRKLDSDGSEILTLDTAAVAALQNKDTATDALTVTVGGSAGDEIIYINCRDYMQRTTTIYALDTGGRILFDYEVDDIYFDSANSISLPDGTVALPVRTQTAQGEMLTLQTINLAAGTLSDDIALPGIAMQVYGGNAEYSVLIGDYGNIYGYNPGEQEIVKLVNWLESNISANAISNITMTQDGRILCNRYASDAQGGYIELLVLTKTLRSDLPEKTVLTLASPGSHVFMSEHIVTFNNSNPFYRIEVVDYSKYGTNDDPDAWVTQLSADIIAGKIPDLFMLSNYGGIPIADYAAAGVFADIYELIDADPELQRDDFLQAPFRAAEIDGKLYRVFSEFTILTMFGDVSVVGNNFGWNLDDLEKVLDAHPGADLPFGPWMNKEALIRFCMNTYRDEFIDWETGTVNFDTPLFIKLLELSDRLTPHAGSYEDNPYAELPSGEAVRDGRMICFYSYINDFQDIARYKVNFGWDIAFVGVPAPDRNGHVVSIGGGTVDLAIAENSPYKDAAWSFARTFLTKNHQIGDADEFFRLSFPTNKAAFDAYVDKTLEICYANSIINGIPDPMPTEQDRIRMQEDIDRVTKLINSTVYMQGSANVDDNLLNIILEEAADFFNGLISAEDAARIIQSKASIYVSERS